MQPRVKSNILWKTKAKMERLKRNSKEIRWNINKDDCLCKIQAKVQQKEKTLSWRKGLSL
jgi:hypothetical protein